MLASTKSERDAELAAAQRRYIEHVVKTTKLTLTEIAHRAGKSHTTLTKFMRDPRRGPLNASTINDIATALRIPVEAPALGAPSGFAEEAEPFAGADDTATIAAVKALLRNRPNADPWVLRTRALEGYGYLPGDIVIVDLSAPPHAGAAVCAQLYDWDKGNAQTIWRIFDPPYLIAYSRDPDLRRPLIVDNERVVIKGVVTDQLRTGRHAA